jgi:hypothetical protein
LIEWQYALTGADVWKYAVKLVLTKIGTSVLTLAYLSLLIAATFCSLSYLLTLPSEAYITTVWKALDFGQQLVII